MTLDAPLDITPPAGLTAGTDVPYIAPPWVELFADGKGLRDALELAVGPLPEIEPPAGIRTMRTVAVRTAQAGAVGMRNTSEAGRPVLLLNYRIDEPSATNLLSIARAALAAYCDIVSDPSAR